jgi:hypothetical protein
LEGRRLTAVSWPARERGKAKAGRKPALGLRVILGHARCLKMDGVTDGKCVQQRVIGMLALYNDIDPGACQWLWIC